MLRIVGDMAEFVSHVPNDSQHKNTLPVAKERPVEMFRVQ